MLPDFVRWSERVFLIALAVWVIVRIAPQLSAHPHLALFLISELFGVAMILLQRRGEWATDLYPVLIAFVGTGAALLVMPGGVQLASDQVSLAFVLAGGAVSLAAKLFLGRSFGLVAANRGVKHGGVYRVVRHPMYFGYILNHIGFLLMFCSVWNLAIYALTWTMLYLRTIEEEKFLRRDPLYRDYAERVRYRLLPGIA